MLSRTFAICALASLASASTALGESLVEVVRPKSLFEYEGLQQGVTFIYDYSGLHQSQRSESVNSFKERYRASTGFSVIDPDLLHLSLGGDVTFNQSSRDSLRQVTYQYNVIGTAFLADPFPTTFSSTHNVNNVVTAFLPSYTATTDVNQVTVSLMSKVLPVRLALSRNTLTTEGLAQDSTTVSNSASLSLTHNVIDRSTTDLQLNMQDSTSSLPQGGETGSRDYNLSGANYLILDKQADYTLRSTLQVSESILAEVPQRSITWEESVSARLGKALGAEVAYQFRDNSTVAFVDGRELTRTVNSIRGTLSHQLFESLNTRVRGHYQRTDLLEGSETATGEGLSLAYRKRLPARSFFTFNVDANHEEVERDVVGTRLPVREELHPGVQQGDLIRLDQLGPLDSVLSVKSRLPDLTYLEGRDYRVNTVLGGIEILAGGTILPGTDLFISYQVLVNPQITFTTDTLTLGSSLSLWQNRYVISGEYVKTDTGSTGIGDPSLYDTTSARLRLDANYEVHKLSAEFADFERGTTRFSYLSGEWRYTKKLPSADLSLFVQDRYSQRETVAPGGGSSDTNDFGAGSSYAGRLFSWGRFTTAVNYTNSTSSSGSSNYLYLKAGLDGRFNQLTLTLAGQSVWRISGSETSRDDNLHFELSRTFY